VILESQYYGIVRAAGYWDGGRKYLEAMEAYHAVTFLRIGRPGSF
jgi:hypothetical protein